jgi:hypothetical protein
MAEMKGKFITLATGLLRSHPGVRSAAIATVKRMTGRTPLELEPEGWYDTKVLDEFLKAVEDGESPLVAWAAIKMIGENVYPTVYAAEGIPEQLKTPLDFYKFEAESFLHDHRGIDVVPRKFIRAEDRYIMIEAPSPGYNCALTEGVFDCILRMCRITRGRVRQTKCVRKGDSTCEYTIQW